MREKICINPDWLFCLGDDLAYAHKSTDEKDFRPVILPHDWSTDYPVEEDAPTGGGGGFARAGIGWYRKHLVIRDPKEAEVWEILFEGVYMDSTVYVNGKEAGGHGYGYTSFYVDITPFLTAGDNVIAVRVNNSLQPNSRWYTGSGIYRDVYLEKHAAVAVDRFGLRCAANGIYEKQNEATLQISTFVKNASDSAVHAGILHKVYDHENTLVSTSGIALFLAPGEVSDCVTRPTVEKPHLWTDDDPYLYTLVSQVVVDDQVVDEISTRIGIRTATFDPKKGFLLNGVQVKIKGMCVHHDCGVTGAVGYEEVWRRRLELLKDMGCNGIRCAHNPPTPVLLNLCDELGFLVMDEAFDEWFLAKNKNHNYYSEQFAYGSSMFFKDHAKEDLTTMLRRDFNHPSVIIWSIGNEIPEQSSIDGPKIAKWLQDICHEEDQSRKVTCACDNIVAVEPIRTLREFENLLDVTGYNYAGRWRERAETFYDEDHEEFPDRCMIGTENGSAGGARGVYDGTGRWGSYAYATVHGEPLWRYTASHDFVAGDYLWTGISYLGETRWPSKGAGGGPLDSAGFKKDTWWYFRSIWNNKADTLHIAPAWNFKNQDGVYKQVVVYTNCEEVELYINDRLVGKKGFSCPRYGCTKSWLDGWGKAIRTTNDLHLEFDVAYEPGILKAVGYRDGKVVMTETVETTGDAAVLKSAAYQEEIKPYGIGQIELWTEDREGRFVPDCNEAVSVEIEGPARLIGLDSGNMADLSVWSEPERKMFSGRLLCTLQALSEGEITAKFTMANGLTTSCRITVK